MYTRICASCVHCYVPRLSCFTPEEAKRKSVCAVSPGRIRKLTCKYYVPKNR